MTTIEDIRKALAGRGMCGDGSVEDDVRALEAALEKLLDYLKKREVTHEHR